jgi:hypothetical protein
MLGAADPLREGVNISSSSATAFSGMVSLSLPNLFEEETRRSRPLAVSGVDLNGVNKLYQ